VEDVVLRFAAVFVMVGAALVVCADELLLRDGRVLRGEVARDGDRYVVEGLYGRMTVPAEEVVKVFRKTSAERVEPDDDDFDAQVRLAKAARSGDERLWRWMLALRKRPDDARARHALGFLWGPEGWAKREELLRRLGWRKVAGRWLSPAEQRRLAAERLARETRRREERKRISERISYLNRLLDRPSPPERAGFIGLTYQTPRSPAPSAVAAPRRCRWWWNGHDWVLIEDLGADWWWWQSRGWAPGYRGGSPLRLRRIVIGGW